MRVHLQMLGCRLNEAELQGWARDFAAAGHEVVDDAGEAELVVFNTCAVTREAARKSRQQIRSARRRSPAARLVVTGCYGTLEPEAAASLLGVDRVIGNGDKGRLVDLVAPGAVGRATGLRVSARQRDRDRAFVKIQDGCRYRCAYCVVTLARGPERSRSRAEVIAEVETLQRNGLAEVVLTGVHVGGYGSDTGDSLAGLVRALLRETAVPRLRLASLEPWTLSAELLELFADPRLMTHLHLPLQSGSDAVLRRMARRCRRDVFLRVVEAARDAVPGLNVTTDVIVGFPGESDDDWRRTVELVDAVGFGDVHVFPFSPRAGTRAALLPDPVPGELRDARAAELRGIAARQRRERLAAAVGQVRPVLLEGGRVPGGYTPDYLRVELPAEAARSRRGRVVDVALEAVTEGGAALYGRLAGSPERGAS